MVFTLPGKWHIVADDHYGQAIAAGTTAASWQVFVVVILVICVVLVPAVWSRRSTRRSAALAVLDRLGVLIEAVTRALHRKS